MSSMKVIDFHTHVFPDEIAEYAISSIRNNASWSENFTDGTVDGLLRSMKNSKITHSVILPIATKEAQVGSINKFVSNILKPEIIPFGTLFPFMIDADKHIGYLKDCGIKGIKFHPEYQDFFVDDLQMFPMYDMLAQAGIITVFHAGKDPGPFTCDHALPSALLTVKKVFPSLKMVAAHLGGWKLWNEVEQNLCGADIYFDTSALPDLIDAHQFVSIVRRHGVDKILFGSDSPWFCQKRTIEWLEHSGLQDDELEKIFCVNALRLLEFN